MPQESIIVASDLSARNDRAVDRAIMLGTQLDRRVVLVHVQDPGSEEGADPAKVEHAVRQTLADPASAIEIVLPSGSAPDEICYAAREHDAAIIVTAVARYNSFRDYVTGTAVDRIISQGRRPVLVVKKRPHRDYRRLFAAVDFSNHSAHALATTAKLFPDAEITVLHAYHVAYEGLQRDAHLKDETRRLSEESMEQFLARPELSFARDRMTPTLAYGSVGGAVFNAVKEAAPDLVIAGTHGAGTVRRAALGSIASDMLDGSIRT